MKLSAVVGCILFFRVAAGQNQHINYDLIDRTVTDMDPSSLPELAQKITALYSSPLERTRAIFSWIAHHINYEELSGKNLNKINLPGNDSASSDTAVLLPLNERVALDVLRKKTAVCYGYTRLFKYLCDYAGIPCEIVNGYARGDFNKIGNNFRTNHSWNAVLIDSSWHLVDVTWASGYFIYGSNRFVKHFDEQYFFTPPEQFAMDHFPDDLGWSLLPQPPLLDEFLNSPYKSRYFIKYNITAYYPTVGIVHASVGDTIHFSVNVNVSGERNISGGSVEDTTDTPPSPRIANCEPLLVPKANHVNYSYVAPSADVQWLQLVYNGDVILRYRLDISNRRQVR